MVSTTDMEPNGSVLHLNDGIAERLNAALAARYESLAGRVSRWLTGGRAPPAAYCRIVPSNENFVALQVGRDHRADFADTLQESEALLRELVDPDSGLPAFIDAARPSTQKQLDRQPSMAAKAGQPLETAGRT